MSFDEQDEFTGRMGGTIWSFLRENRFRVELDDGQIVEAVLPDELMETMRPFYSGPPITDRIGVVVEFREPPGLHRILEVKGASAWCGLPRPARR
jgi:hypothetical protein